MGWTHLAAGSLWGLGRFKARQLSGICLVNEAAGCAPPFAGRDQVLQELKRRGDGIVPWLLYGGWVGAGMHQEKVVTLKKNLVQVSKGADSRSTKARKSCGTAAQCSKCPENIPYPSTNYPTFDGSRILK